MEKSATRVKKPPLSKSIIRGKDARGRAGNGGERRRHQAGSGTGEDLWGGKIVTHSQGK